MFRGITGALWLMNSADSRNGWRSRVDIILKFEPRDIWVGVYWKRSTILKRLDFWICIVPMVPLHIRWWRAGY